MMVLRRHALGSAMALVALAATSCRASEQNMQTSSANGHRFDGTGILLVVDAVPGAQMLGVEFYGDEAVRPLYAKSRMVQRNREIMSFPGGGRLPSRVRVVWRDSSKIVGRKDNPDIDTYDGRVLGDYTIPILDRIPLSVDDALRSQPGGGLRLKFRLKPDGVLFGWDIERVPAHDRERARRDNLYYPPYYENVGGDFLDTKY
jgi:hypothetical protein